MKKFYLLNLAILAFTFSFATPIIKASTDGNWNNASSWDLNRIPQDGDSIVIPSNKTITITNDQTLNGMVILRIYGKLKFENNNSTLNLSTISSVWVLTGGRIEGNGSASQKLKIGSSQVYKGKDADVTGPAMANATNNGFTPFVELGVVLPVKFMGFTISRQNTDVLVQWSTTQEINADMYEIERSYDGSNWNLIAYVAAFGTTQNVNSYSYSDKNISAKVVYYRIKQVDQDGRFTYTSINVLKTESLINSDVKIAAINKKVLLQFSKEFKGTVVVRFVSLNGQVVDQQVINDVKGQVVLTSKAIGNHIVSLSNGLDLNVAKQVIL